MSKVSVIVPVYNVSKYLERCLNSIINQTLNDIDIICIDDGSTDGCSDILKSYENIDERFKIIKQDNRGLSVARNTGLTHATGDYIFFLDSDDEIHFQLLEICTKVANEYNADLVYFGSENVTEDFGIRENKNITYERIKLTQTSNPLLLGSKSRNKIIFNVWNKLYKRTLLNDIKFIPNMLFEDLPFTYKVLSKHPKTVVLDAVLHYYRQRDNSITKSTDSLKRMQFHFIAIKEIIDIFSKSKNKKDLAYIKRDFIPTILHEQHKQLLKANSEFFTKSKGVFVEELNFLRQANLLSPIYCKIHRYFKYLNMMKGK